MKNGKIVSLGNGSGTAKAAKIVDVGGKHILPGAIDTHVHIAWPDWDWEEDCVATTKAAAAGGVTTVMCMTGQSRSMFEEIEERSDLFEKNSYVDGTFHECIYNDQHIQEIVPMATTGGITSFKFFIPYRGAEVVPPQVGIDDGIIYMGFNEIGRLNLPGLALVHAENIEVFFKLKEKFLAENATPEWNDTRPNFSEVESIRRVVAFAKATGCALYIVHLSTKESGDEILRARAEGVTIYGETCPQYLSLTTNNSDRILAKVNPPIRTQDDVDGLWKWIREGVISCIGSDHATCATGHKREFWSAVVGFAGAQLLLPIILSEGVNKGRIGLEKVAAITSDNAAKIFGLYPKKGSIEVGADADLAVIDLDLEREIHAKDLYHISDFTPYEGWKLRGWPVETYVRGKLVMKDGKIVGDKAYGRCLVRKATMK